MKRSLIGTGAGVKCCMLTSRNESAYEFETAMGEPQLGANIPPIRGGPGDEAFQFPSETPTT